MTPPFDLPPIRKILIRVNNWIGDVVMISPAMRAIRRRFPEAQISLLASTWVVDALRGSPDYDRLIEYERRGRHAGPTGFVRLVRSLRGERFDLAILFQKAFEAALLSLAAGIPIRAGFRTDRRAALLTHSLDLPEEGHHVDQFLLLAEALGCDASDRRLHFHIDQASRDTAWAFLSRAGLLGDSPRVAIHPGASKPPRGWHPERFAEAAAALAIRPGIRPILLGAAGDRPVLAQIAARIGPAAVLAPPETTLREMAAILERCHLLICNDSGPMHVAAALRVPVAAVFGPGHPNRTAPFVDRSLYRVVSRNYPCSPCRQKFFHECIPAPSGKPYCLEEVSVESVVRAGAELLGSAGGTKGGGPRASFSSGEGG